MAFSLHFAPKKFREIIEKIRMTGWRIKSSMRLRKRVIRFIVMIQSVLFLTHLFLYETWIYSPESQFHASTWLKPIALLLSVSFVAASLLAFRYTNAVIRSFYRVAA